MKLSKETLEILKNLAVFQNQLLIESGDTLRIKPSSALYIEAHVPEKFPTELAVPDLAAFNKIIGWVNEPELDYDADKIRIVDGETGREEVIIPLAQAPLKVPRVPQGGPKVASSGIEFDLTEATWRKIEKAASLLYAPEIRIVSKDGILSIFTHNSKLPNSPSYEIDIPPSRNDVTCNCILSLDNARFLKGAYLVTVASGYSRFKNISGRDITYWVAHEHGSSFGS
jgi:hypothetical protein